MSKYYRSQRVRNLYEPASPYVLSRSRLETFLTCARCFYNDRRLGVDRPPGFPFTLNSAVDHLLKKEFDSHRQQGTPHPLMTSAGIDAIPYAHDQLETWRDALHGGIRFFHSPTKFTVTGAIDDLWVWPSGEISMVDYKATSKKDPVDLEQDWQMSYKRQMEIYGWLFSQNGFKVSPKSFFVYCNGRTDLDRFDHRLHFHVSIIPYVINYDWVEDAIRAAFKCLNANEAPEPSAECDYCAYHSALSRHS